MAPIHKTGASLLTSCLLLVGCIAGCQRVVHVQAVVDGKSELVIAPGGLYWHHIQHAKPGNFGPNYDLAGPTYVDSVPWTAQWQTPVADRVEDVSDIHPMSTKGFCGFRLSGRYDYYFDEYPQGARSEWTTLKHLVKLNRGQVTLVECDGCPAIRIDDPMAGQNVYSIELLFR